MKEIALAGTTCRVFGDVLGALLDRGLSVNAMVDFPERIMLDDSRLTVTHFNPANHEAVAEAFKGYDTVVLAYNDDPFLLNCQ